MAKKYKLPLKFFSELIFNFEGSYYDCNLFDSNGKTLLNYKTEYDSSRKDFRNSCVRIVKYCNKNPEQFSKLDEKIGKCNNISDLSNLARKLGN